MNKLLIQQSNNKFIQNTIHSDIANIEILSMNMDGSLYKIYYSLKPTHILFDRMMLTDEILQFIQEFAKDIKIFLYHNVFDKPIYDSIPDSVVHLYTYGTGDDIGQNIIQVPSRTVNTKVFISNQLIAKNDSIICFLDKYPQLPSALNNILFPKTKIPLKLFNAPNTPNDQNLGIINYITKSNLMRSHKYYLCIDKYSDEYIAEAQLCGCIIVDLDQIARYQELEYSSCSDYTDHSELIKDIILK